MKTFHLEAHVGFAWIRLATHTNRRYLEVTLRTMRRARHRLRIVEGGVIHQRALTDLEALRYVRAMGR